MNYYRSYRRRTRPIALLCGCTAFIGTVVTLMASGIFIAVLNGG